MENSNKLHEETLKIAKSLIERDPALKDWVTEKFPELKESKDEKIMKEIIQSIQDNMCVIHKDECIAWPEKQGERNLIESNEEWYSFIRWFVKERTDNYTLIPSDDDIHKWSDMILNHVKKLIERQGQNPAWSDEDEEIFQSCLNILQEKGFMGVGVIETINSKWLKSLKDRVQPKQEWSEEDVLNLNCILSCMDEDAKLPRETISRLCNWLKSLKDRIQPQLKQERGEEDEKALDSILNDLRQGVIPDNDDINWLKSLKERISQPHWKPSEEQMKMLRAIVYEPYEVEAEFRNVSCRKILETLYKDLKTFES